MRVKRRGELRCFEETICGDVFLVTGSIYVDGRLEDARDLACLRLRDESWRDFTSCNAVTLEAGMTVKINADHEVTVLDGKFVEGA